MIHVVIVEDDNEIRNLIVKFIRSTTDLYLVAAYDRGEDLANNLTKGLSYKEITTQLFISIGAVRTYLRKIYEKLQVHSKVEALNKVFPKDIMG